jgi:hypothetical protein
MMTIEYPIHRMALVRAYYRNLLRPTPTRTTVLRAAAILAIIILAERYLLDKQLTPDAFFIALLMSVVFILIVPIYGLIFAKSQKRVLTIGPDGIDTLVGNRKGKILWSEVESVASSSESVILTGKNANSLVIPTQAFTSPEHRNSFIEQTQAYLHVAPEISPESH